MYHIHEVNYQILCLAPCKMFFKCRIFSSENFFEKENIFNYLVVFWKICPKMVSNVWFAHKMVIGKYV